MIELDISKPAAGMTLEQETKFLRQHWLVKRMRGPGRAAMAKACAGRVVVTPDAGSGEHPGVPRAHRRHPSQFGKAAAIGKGKRHAKQLPGLWRKRAEAKAKQKAAMVVYKMPEFKQSA